MSTDEKKPDGQAEKKPKASKTNLKGSTSKQPEKPQAPTEKNIQSESEMPDLDKFNFMNW